MTGKIMDLNGKNIVSYEFYVNEYYYIYNELAIKNY